MVRIQSFKQTFKGLMFAHTITLALGLILGAGLLTLLVIYALQSFAVLLIMTIIEFKDAYLAEKVSVLLRMLIFMVFIVANLVFVIVVSKHNVVYVNDVPQTVRLGSLSIVGVIAGTITFTAEYWLTQRKLPKVKKGYIDPFAFFKIFTRVVSMILITTIAFSFESSRLALTMITLIKLSLDIGMELLDKVRLSF